MGWEWPAENDEVHTQSKMGRGCAVAAGFSYELSFPSALIPSTGLLARTDGLSLRDPVIPRHLKLMQHPLSTPRTLAMELTSRSHGGTLEFRQAQGRRKKKWGLEDLDDMVQNLDL